MRNGRTKTHSESSSENPTRRKPIKIERSRNRQRRRTQVISMIMHPCKTNTSNKLMYNGGGRRSLLRALQTGSFRLVLVDDEAEERSSESSIVLVMSKLAQSTLFGLTRVNSASDDDDDDDAWGSTTDFRDRRRVRMEDEINARESALVIRRRRGFVLGIMRGNAGTIFFFGGR